MARYDASGLLHDGVLVPATVVGVRDTGFRHGDSDDFGRPPIWAWSLSVEAPDGPYRVSCEQDVPWDLARVARPGRQVLVRVHPQDRARVVVDAIETVRWRGGPRPVRGPAVTTGPGRRVAPEQVDQVGAVHKPVPPGRGAPRAEVRTLVVTAVVLAVAAVVLLAVAPGRDGTSGVVLFGLGGLCAVLAVVFALVGRWVRRLVRPPRRSVVAQAHLVEVEQTSGEQSTANVYRVVAAVHLVDRVERVRCSVLVPAVEESVFGEGRWLAVRVAPRRPRRIVPDWDATEALQARAPGR